MRKSLKIIVPLICVAVVAITFYMIHDIRNKVEQANYGTDDIEVADENIQEENVVQENNVEENIVKENVVSENTTVEEENTNTAVTNTTLKEEVTEEEDSYSKTKLDQAKNLVEKTWGKDDTVYFTNEGINSDGLYMVAVRDKTSTAVKNYFKVNLETKKVQIDY